MRQTVTRELSPRRVATPLTESEKRESSSRGGTACGAAVKLPRSRRFHCVHLSCGSTRVAGAKLARCQRVLKSHWAGLVSLVDGRAGATRWLGGGRARVRSESASTTPALGGPRPTRAARRGSLCRRTGSRSPRPGRPGRRAGRRRRCRARRAPSVRRDRCHDGWHAGGKRLVEHERTLDLAAMRSMMTLGLRRRGTSGILNTRMVSPRSSISRMLNSPGSASLTWRSTFKRLVLGLIGMEQL